MKILGVLACFTLLTVSLPGTSAPAEPIDHFARAAAMNEAITGHDIDFSQAELRASEEFTLPAGATGVQAWYDDVTGVLTVAPISAMPDTNGESGCIIANSFVGFGYTKSGTPPPVGDYTNGCQYAGQNEHPGTADSVSIACLNNQYCQVVGYGFQVIPPFNFSYRYVYLFCQFNTVTVSQASFGAPPSTLGTGICQAFSFQFGAAPAAHYGYVYSYPPGLTAAAAGLVNY